MSHPVEVVEEVVYHKQAKKYYVANRAEEVPKSKVEKIGAFFWKKRDSK
jgi:hypothetical protein